MRCWLLGASSVLSAAGFHPKPMSQLRVLGLCSPLEPSRMLPSPCLVPRASWLSEKWQVPGVGTLRPLGCVLCQSKAPGSLGETWVPGHHVQCGEGEQKLEFCKLCMTP